MADARDFLVVDSSGVPLTGAAGSMTAIARDIAGATRTPPAIVELALGEYRVVPTDADETAGTVVLIDTGVGNSPRHVVWECFKADRSNQFFALCVENPDLSLWAGAAPTVAAYRSGAGARTAPTLVAVAGAYLFVAVPTAADVTADTAIRIDGPAGSAQPYWYDSTGPLVASTPTLPPSTGNTPDGIAVDAFVEYFRRYLPGKCAAINATRQAVLKSALVEPFTIGAGGTLKISAVSQEVTPTTVTLPTGSVTAAALAAAINATPVPNITASADSAGRLVLTASAAPAAGAASIVVVATDTTGANLALGWADGGEHSERAALVAPSWRGVCDGRPLGVPDQGQGFWVMLGHRSCRPWGTGIRRDLHDITINVDIWRPFSANGPPHRTSEAITACVRAVRELVLTTDGRYLGRQGAGDIQLANVSTAEIAGDPIQLNELPGVLFDTARLTLTCRVFQRPE